jgi:hypothetical protein
MPPHSPHGRTAHATAPLGLTPGGTGNWVSESRPAWADKLKTHLAKSSLQTSYLIMPAPYTAGCFATCEVPNEGHVLPFPSAAKTLLHPLQSIFDYCSRKSTLLHSLLERHEALPIPWPSPPVLPPHQQSTCILLQIVALLVLGPFACIEAYAGKHTYRSATPTIIRLRISTRPGIWFGARTS